MNVTSFRIHNDQVELLDSLCSQLRCSHSFFIRQLISNCSTELFERLNTIRLKNESHRITTLSNRYILQSLKKPNTNLGKSYPTNPKLTNQQILKQMKYLYNKNKLSTNQQHLNHLKSLLSNSK